MATPDLKTFLRLAHDHLHTLSALHNAPHGLRETDIRARLERTRSSAAGPSVAHVFRQLRDHGLIEPLPEQSALYEPTMRVRRLLREFQRAQSLTTPKVIRGHLEQLETDRNRLADYGRQGSQTGALRALERISEELEEIRRLSRQNREAILHRVTALRAETKGLSVQERFAAILEMIDDHIHPLERIVDTNGPAERHFIQLEETLTDVRTDFADAPAVFRELAFTGARLRRVRRRVLHNFEAARDEVIPLFESQKRSSMLARGASKLLKAVHAQGPQALGLDETIQIQYFHIRTPIDSDALRSFLLTMRSYTPAPPDPISKPDDSTTPLPAPRRDVLIAHLTRACPVPDVMDWLIAHYEEASTSHVLAAYRHVLQSPLRVSFSSTPRTYVHGDYALTTAPAQVTTPDAAPSTHSPETL